MHFLPHLHGACRRRGRFVLVEPQAAFFEFETQAVEQPADYSNTRELGKVLYTEYVFPFEVASVILLVAIVAAIALTMRRREMTKYQTPGKQVQVRKEDRLRVVKMDAETNE